MIFRLVISNAFSIPMRKVVVTGIRPAVAITLIELGIRLEDVSTAIDLENGLEKLQQELGD